MAFIYSWGNNPRRAQLKGRLCLVLAIGRMKNVLLLFPDTGEKVVSDIRALR